MNSTTDSSFHWLMSYLIPEFCYVEFFVNLNFLHGECIRILISKGLGLGIIAGSALVKLPQIIKILRSSSVSGLSAVGNGLELAGVTSTLAYGVANHYPFSSFGEALFLILQTLMVLLLILLYRGHLAQALILLLLYVTTLYTLTSGLTPLTILTSLQAANIPLAVGGKLTQAASNYHQGSTGQLSAITVLLVTAGGLARIFTSYQETGDAMMMMTFTATSIANLILTGQIFYYWNKGVVEKKIE